MMEKDMKDAYYRLVDQAIEKGDVSEDYLDYLLGLPCETLDDQEYAYKELLACGLQTKLFKGAAYIEDIGVNHPHYQAAMRKYDKLTNELKELKEGRVWHKNDSTSTKKHQGATTTAGLAMK